MHDSARHDLRALNDVDGAAWLAHMRRGAFEDAWLVSDRILARGRLWDHTAPRHFQQIWDGTPLAGRRVLIRCYHGLGDTVQFIRYAPLVHASAREVIVWAQPALVPLLHGMDGIDRVLPLHDGTPDVEYDVDVELMELPYVFRTTLATIPTSRAYLHAEPLPIAAPRPRIGLVWRGGGWDQRRSLPLAALAPLLDVTGCEWYSLQHDREPGERHPRLAPLPVDGLVPTARAMRSLDLVITIDSLPAHLAGALGVPAWTLLATPADWRWMEGRVDSPWYPTMRLFRQPREGDWDAVVADVREALLAFVNDYR